MRYHSFESMSAWSPVCLAQRLTEATEERDEALAAAEREWRLAELLRQELAGESALLHVQPAADNHGMLTAGRSSGQCEQHTLACSELTECNKWQQGVGS